MPQITVTTTPPVIALLMTLGETGLYGRTIEETAERLICEALQTKVAHGGILQGRQRG